MEHNISAQLERFKDSFLVAAAKAGSAQEVHSLLEMGADVSWRSLEGNLGDTALLAAVRNGHRDVASILLAMGADPTDATSILPGAENFGGDTALHLACRRGDEDHGGRGPHGVLHRDRLPGLPTRSRAAKVAAQLSGKRLSRLFLRHLNNRSFT